MDKCWIEYAFPVPSDRVDELSDLLCDFGCVGVNVEEKVLDTFVVPSPDANTPSSYLVRAYFPFEGSRESTEEMAARIRPLLPEITADDISVSQIREEDWAEGWKQHFTAMKFGSRLVVRPTWEEAPVDGDAAIVSLDPGMAFGTGSHETTRLCLQALAECFDDGPVPASVLDVGTGSGILAIAAAALGGDDVVGCEIDADARSVAEENVVLNGVASSVTITGELLEDITGRFDLVIANIMAEENVRLAAPLVEHLNEGGRLILSGILKEKEAFVREGFGRFDLPEPSVRYENEWCCISYRKGAADE